MLLTLAQEGSQLHATEGAEMTNVKRITLIVEGLTTMAHRRTLNVDGLMFNEFVLSTRNTETQKIRELGIRFL